LSKHQALAVALTALLATLSFAQGKPRPQAKAEPPAKAAAESPGLPSEATVDSYLKHMFSYDPGIAWKILSIKPSQAPNVAVVTALLKGSQGSQVVRLFVMPGGEWAVVGDMVPFGADPFAHARNKLAAGAHGPSRGPANAAVTIVEFSDLQCPACKTAQPTIERLLAEVPDVRFVFQNFPLENLHPWASRAAAYADCLGRANNEAFWKFIHTVYENQEQVTTENVDQKMTDFAQQSGGNGKEIAACAAQPATAERVKQSEALGLALNVSGTPTLFINGREIPNVTSIPYEMLKQFATQKD
jgi:protein-disulfide isomerase